MATIEDDFIKQETKERLLNVIKDLNDRDRMFMSLYYYENMNYKEIAQILSCTVSNVSKVHQKILNALKVKLESTE